MVPQKRVKYTIGKLDLQIFYWLRDIEAYAQIDTYYTVSIIWYKMEGLCELYFGIYFKSNSLCKEDGYILCVRVRAVEQCRINITIADHTVAIVQHIALYAGSAKWMKPAFLR